MLLTVVFSYGWNILPGPHDDSQESMLLKVGKKFSLILESSGMPSGLLIKGRPNDLKDLSVFFSYLRSRMPFSPRAYSPVHIEQSLLTDFLETVGDQ